MVEAILAIAKSVGISGQLLLAVCSVETNLRNVNNFADHHEGTQGSYGVCQLSLDTARQISPNIDMLALQQPKVNIRIAARYLQKLIQKYGNMLDAIAAYNAGCVKLRRGEYVNKKYVDKVAFVYYNL